MRMMALFMVSLLTAGTARAECHSAEPWRMGDATENTFGGKLVEAGGGRVRLSMDGAPYKDGGELQYEFGARFSLSAGAYLPPGSYEIRYEFDGPTPVQSVRTQSPGSTLDHVDTFGRINNPVPGFVTVSISQTYQDRFEATVSPLSFCSASISAFDDGKSVSGWRDYATTYLERPGKQGITVTPAELEKHVTLRCIRLNNYWCLKDMGWQGRLGRDVDNHTAFSTPEWGARAAARNFRTAYVKHGRKSARAILTAYSPAKDCRGSQAARLADGRCSNGFNDVDEAAAAAARGITDDLDEDLQLFDAEGRATANLKLFLSNLAVQETGLRPLDAIVESGIRLEVK